MLAPRRLQSMPNYPFFINPLPCPPLPSPASSALPSRLLPPPLPCPPLHCLPPSPKEESPSLTPLKSHVQTNGRSTALTKRKPWGAAGAGLYNSAALLHKSPSTLPISGEIISSFLWIRVHRAVGTRGRKGERGRDEDEVGVGGEGESGGVGGLGGQDRAP